MPAIVWSTSWVILSTWLFSEFSMMGALQQMHISFPFYKVYPQTSSPDFFLSNSSLFLLLGPWPTIWSMSSYNHTSGHIFSPKVYYDTTHLLQWPKSGLLTPNAGKVWSNRKLPHCWWKFKMVQPLWETVWWFLTEQNILLPNDLAIVVFGIYPKELKTYVHTKTCTWMFIVTLFIISKICKQPRCSLVGEWINWYIQTMKCYSMIKRNELSSHEKTWMNL